MGRIGLADLPAPPPGKSGWPWTRDAAPPPPSGRHWPTITIVTPSYNQAEFLEETIRSALLQGYPDLEYMVVDGGSSDGSVDVIRRYQPWLAYWVSERDRGQSHAINKGLGRASGELFGYLNSDDLLAPGGLSAAVQVALAHPDADAYYGRCRCIDREGRELFICQGQVRDLADYLRLWERLRRREALTQPEVFCRTRTLRELGGFREDLHFLLDYEMWLRVLAAGRRFQPVDAVVAHFRTYEGQKSKASDAVGGELFRVVSGYVQRARDRLGPDDVRRLSVELAEAVAQMQLTGATTAAEEGRAAAAWRACAAAVRVHPRILGTYRFWTTVAGPLKRHLPRAFRQQLRETIRGRERDRSA